MQEEFAPRGRTAGVCFIFEMARAPRHFLLGKGHPMRKLSISTAAFQGHQGNDRHGGNRLRCQSVKYQALNAL